VTLAADEKIIVEDPKYFKKVSKILKQTDKKIIANYLGWRTYDSVVPYLNKAAREFELDMKKEIVGVAKAKPDWTRCLRIIGFNKYDGKMPASAASLYVRHFFNPEEKKLVEIIITYIRRAFDKMLDDLEWMDDQTRQRAKKKLDRMSQNVAYPDELLDQSVIDGYYRLLGSLEPDTFLQNVLKLNRFGIARNLRQLREKVDPNHWTEYLEVTANAFYMWDSNKMDIPAGLLQGVFFNSQRPQYMNFGAVGVIIGHEITHGFDDIGRNQDFEGKLVDWWEASTAANYNSRAQCIIDQYGNFTAREIDLNLNGINTQGENIADNGGVKEAYLGYQSYAESHRDKQLPGWQHYTPNQMFWISFGQSWCSKYKPGKLKSQILTGVHSPEEFRVNGPLSNNHDFSRDFNCPIGSPMNPVKKCTVW